MLSEVVKMGRTKEKVKDEGENASLEEVVIEVSVTYMMKRKM